MKMRAVFYLVMIGMLAVVNTPVVPRPVNTTLKMTNFSDANGWDQAQYYATIRFPDVNGDSRSDVCGRGIAGVYCSVDDGAGALINNSLWQSSFSDANGWNQAQYYSTIQFPDVNGDG